MNDLLVTITARTTKREFNQAVRRLNEAMHRPFDVSDLVGTIVLHEDPVAYQRRIRDEWEDDPIPAPTKRSKKK